MLAHSSWLIAVFVSLVVCPIDRCHRYRRCDSSQADTDRIAAQAAALGADGLAAAKQRLEDAQVRYPSMYPIILSTECEACELAILVYTSLSQNILQFIFLINTSHGISLCVLMYPKPLPQAANAPVVPLAMQESLPIPDPAAVPLIPIAIVSNLAGRSTLHSANADGKKSEEVEVLLSQKNAWTYERAAFIFVSETEPAQFNLF